MEAKDSRHICHGRWGQSLADAIRPYFDTDNGKHEPRGTPFAKLPDALKKRIDEVFRQPNDKGGFERFMWDDLDPRGRMGFAEEHDSPTDTSAQDEMGMHLEGIRRGLKNFRSHPRVTPDDAALLMCGINPARKSGITSSDKTTAEDYEALLALFKAEQDVNGGHKTLKEWLALAEKEEQKHHPVVRQYLEFASNLAGDECLTTDAQDATPVPEVDGDHPEEWKLKAQEHAKAIIKRDRKKDLYPSQENVSDEVARTLRESGVFGAGGKPLTGAYIKRHALKGISSAQGRQLSTSIRRGK